MSEMAMRRQGMQKRRLELQGQVLISQGVGGREEDADLTGKMRIICKTIKER